MTQPNAVAGPSHAGHSLVHNDLSTTTALTTGIGGLSLAYLAPDPAPPRARSTIHPTHDLLGRYGILPVYDEFVRPFTTSAPSTIEDKGKRKEDEADEGRHGPKEGLFQHGYKAFIKDLGLGKHNHKKDTFLTDLMQMPDKPPVQVAKIDRSTLVHAFRLKEGGVPGFNTSALTGDDKERKKKVCAVIHLFPLIRTHMPLINYRIQFASCCLQKKKRPIDPSQPSAPATPAAGPSTPGAAAPIRRPTGPLPPSQLASSHVPSAQQTPQRPSQQQPSQQRHPLPANPKTAAAGRPPGTGVGTGGGTVKRKDREDGVNGHVGNMGGNMGQ
ncbi:hypothetical protein B0J17DRAFT_765792 [Rhizoctonia solani]|nr:hypothetical protein B0J17DRAFT_765792 [Rhizoctonia solani]